jgi:hypothetical protein
LEPLTFHLGGHGTTFNSNHFLNIGCIREAAALIKSFNRPKMDAIHYNRKSGSHVGQNKCQRSEDIISASNASKNLISNTGDECSVVGSFAGDDVQFIVPKEISGKVEEMPYGKQISFDNAHQPSVMFPTYLDKFNGEISEMAIPNGTAFVDIRVPLSCIRVDAH